MRIISGFRDYYDGVMKTGMDRETVYVRERKEVVLKDALDIDFTTAHVSSAYKAETIFLGYCGAIYKVYVISFDGWKHVFYEFEDFKSFMLSNGFGGMFDFSESRWWPSGYMRFKNCNVQKMTELFHQFQTPLFTVAHVYSYSKPDKTTVTLNPCLKDFEFQKIKDPYTAFQDIFQYVAGTLNRSENKMVKISDKDKIHKHGFDKWSFRRLPSKKGKK